VGITTLSLMTRHAGGEDRRSEARREGDTPRPSGPNWAAVLVGLVVTLSLAYGATLWARVDRIDSGVQTHYQVAAAKAVELDQLKHDVAEIKASQEEIRQLITRKSEVEAENNQLLRQLAGKRAR
jgi:Tfp pilus assembly protein PilO